MHKEFKNDIEACLTVLRNGGIILYPTDTVWGLGCDAANEAAVQKIIQLKNRPEHKSFVILVAGVQELKQSAGRVDDLIISYLATAPKPTTVIYPEAVNIADSAVAADGSVAIRICREPFCAELLRRLGRPVVSTSANISGQNTPAVFKEIDDIIIKGVDYTVKYRQDDMRVAAPSTIVKWEDGDLKVLRG